MWADNWVDQRGEKRAGTRAVLKVEKRARRLAVRKAEY